MKMRRKISILLAVILVFMAPVSVFADRVDADLNKPYISLGADLNAAERDTVLQLLGVSENELANYTVVEITNEDEHKYLDSYLDAGVIGSRALSSVLVEGKEEGNGIQVTTQNISYCTVGMYQNALATAGIKDANIKVVGPFKISGTAGLVGAIKSYENMTGEKVDEDNIDVATNELVVTSELADNISDPEKAEELIGMIKNEIANGNFSDEEIGSMIDQAASKMEISLSEEDRQKIIDLMNEIKNLDLDVNQLKEQIGGLYDKIKDWNINFDFDQEQAENFLMTLWNKIQEFLSSLFG